MSAIVIGGGIYLLGKVTNSLNSLHVDFEIRYLASNRQH